jgi:hypothetical protein
MASTGTGTRLLAGALAVTLLGSGVLLFIPGVGRGLPTLLFFGSCLATLMIKQTQPERERIDINEQGVLRVLRNGQREWVAWSALVEVWIITTSEGPAVDDFFFILRAEDGTGCAVSSMLAGDLLQRLQRLPRFDNTQVILASGSTEDARFVCWTGSPGEGLVAAALPGEPSARC